MNGVLTKLQDLFISHVLCIILLEFVSFICRIWLILNFFGNLSMLCVLLLFICSIIHTLYLGTNNGSIKNKLFNRYVSKLYTGITTVTRFTS